MTLHLKVWRQQGEKKDGEVTSRLFAPEQTSESMLKVLGYGD